MGYTYRRNDLSFNFYDPSNVIHRTSFAVFGKTIHGNWPTVTDIWEDLIIIKKTSSVYDCTVEDVEYICNSNSTLRLFYFAIFVVLLLS